MNMITPTKEFWEVFKNTDGALSCAEAVAIMNLAALAPQGTYIELGTHKGKSAMAACGGLPDGKFYLVDPIYKDKNIFDEVNATLQKQDKAVNHILLNNISTEVIWQLLEVNNISGYAYVFVDSGSHQDGLPMQEVKLLEDRMVQGGIIAFHDYQSQFVEVEQAYNYLVGTGKYTPIHINWNEINAYVDENNIEEGNRSWHHQEMKNPNFVGAVKRK